MPAGKISNNGRGGIGRVIVDHHHMQTVARVILRQQRTDAATDIGLLVARRNDHSDTGSALGVWWRRALQPSQKPALPEGTRDQPSRDR